MQAFKLNCWASWKSLPWEQINERIFILQKKIYQVSRACKYHSVHKMQNTLINSNEAKVLAIEEIFKSLYKSSISHNQDNYQLDDKDKVLIFYSLFQKQKKDKTLTILVEKIKQYLIYLCLQPEWEARLEPGLQTNVNVKESYTLQGNLDSFLDYTLSLPQNWNGIYFECQINNKYIDPIYISRKVQSGNYINHCLSFWLNNNYIEQCIQVLMLNLKFSALNQLLYRIICNGIEWFDCMITESRLKSQQYNFNIYQDIFIYYYVNAGYWIYINHYFVNDLNFILKLLDLSINKYNILKKNYRFYLPYYYIFEAVLSKKQYLYQVTQSDTIMNNLCRFLFRLVKYLLYRKDFLNRLRVNSNINISKAILYVNNLILKFYEYYCLFLPLKIVKDISQQVDFILYSWIKKRNKNKHLSRITIHRSKKYLIKGLLESKNHIIQKISIEKLNRE